MNALFIKIIAWLLTVLNAFLPNFGTMNVLTGLTGNTAEVLDSAAGTPTEIYAYNVKNRVNAVYSDTDRDTFTITNNQVEIVNSLLSSVKSTTITDRDGNEYLGATLMTFCKEKNGVKKYFEYSTGKSRVNTIRFGEYTYDCHVRDMQRGNYYADKGFYVYADRVYMQNTLLADEPTENLEYFGTEVKVPACKLNSVTVSANGNTYTEGTFDAEDVDYIALDTKDAGIAGFIIPHDGTDGKIEVKKSGAFIIVNIYAGYIQYTGINDYNEEGGYALNNVTNAFRIYTDSTHDIAGIEKAAYEEHNPLTVTVTANDSNAEYLGYDAKRGVYTIKMDGTNFNIAYANPDYTFRAPFTVENSGDERDVYFRVYTDVGALEAGVLYDGDGNEVALDAEICKNFCGDISEDIYSPKDYSYGDMYFPIVAESNSSASYIAEHLYQNYGGVPLKQLSSIEYFNPYYHLSTGVTETNCIATQFADNEGFYLPDFRTGSDEFWPEQPQHNSIGILKFTTVNTLTTENAYNTEFAGTRVDSTGPVYADVTNYYTDDCGAFTVALRHVELPQTDENRTYYQMTVTFTKTVSYTNFKRDFNLFSFNGRFNRFTTAFMTDESGEIKTAAVNTTGKAVYYSLGTVAPSFGFVETTRESVEEAGSDVFGCNFGLFVKNAQITKSGVTSTLPLVFRDTSTDDETKGFLTADYGAVTFRKGDTISIDMILLPFGGNFDSDISHAETVRNDSAVNPASITVTKGTAADDTYIQTVALDGNEAQFTISGGAYISAVKITGLHSKNVPAVTVDGGEVYGGYDFCLESDGLYSVSFLVKTDGNTADITVTE